ncbi:hypothetical protein BCR33DRAFT_731068 [Rhizoclosmatium globosum]|uniref:Uncharacterized protein n=1 Tax=Rhizoclosmatium globosum TaxID=329046 RepID=A0A1Y2A4B5_9FUNG|nr:hypothetical protein BCR33DRAFT_731068 [Rhizoclosmatium globosum]|eukprot:ORY17361.1 hypothetical protein BCR33DRAFT_731068 [Rhizoclosmatium globosum]
MNLEATPTPRSSWLPRKRLRLPKIHTNPYFPPILHDKVAETLALFWTFPQIPLLSHLVGHSPPPILIANTLFEYTLVPQTTSFGKRPQFLDLCTGAESASVAVEVTNQLEARFSKKVLVTLSHVDPANIQGFEENHVESVRVSARGVDPGEVPRDMKGAIRLLIGKLHEMEDRAIFRILRDCVEKRSAIVAIEFHDRTVVSVWFWAFVVPFLAVPFTILFGKKRLMIWNLILLSLALPWLVWDGIVSCLGAVNIEELKDLLDDIPEAHMHITWTWKRVGLISLNDGVLGWFFFTRWMVERLDSLLAVTMLIGVPKLKQKQGWL